MSTGELPVVNLADIISGDEAKVFKAANALRDGFGYYGLVCISGVDEYYKSKDGKKTTFELYDQFVELLKRPSEELHSYGGAKIWFQRGYTPPNTEVGVASGGKPDLKECWFNQCGGTMDKRCQKWYPEIYAPNVWPKSAEGFEEAYRECGNALNDIGSVLLELSEKALDVPEGSFTKKAKDGCHLTRVLRYIELDEGMAKRSADGEVNWGEEHTDMNLLTVLPGGAFYQGPDRQPSGTAPPGGGAGLYLRARPTEEFPTGQKVKGVPPPGCFIAQVGQQLEVLSGGAFIATPHHIVAPTVPGWSRCSMAHFVHMRGDAVVCPEPNTSAAPDADAIYAPPVLAGTYVTKTIVDIGLAGPEQLSKFGYRNYDRLNQQRAEDAQKAKESGGAAKKANESEGAAKKANESLGA